MPIQILGPRRPSTCLDGHFSDVFQGGCFSSLPASVKTSHCQSLPFAFTVEATNGHSHRHTPFKPCPSAGAWFSKALGASGQHVGSGTTFLLSRESPDSANVVRVDGKDGSSKSTLHSQPGSPSSQRAELINKPKCIYLSIELTCACLEKLFCR